jgi:hypothetical protein
MTERITRFPWRPSRLTLIATGLIVVGMLLTGVNEAFLVLVGIGMFGPGVLRELGLVHDKDEFQKRGVHRAGYHAFLVAGIVATLFAAYLRSGDRDLKDLEELATFFLALLWFTWLFSYLLSYWGAQKTAIRILLTFGSLWALFNIFGNLKHPVAMLMQLLGTAAPFFVLAFTAKRWPRVTGVLLITASVAFMIFFGWHDFTSPDLVTHLLVMLLFLGPLVGSGIALLRPGVVERSVEE